MFKVGDEVFIKAEITDVHRECDKPYFVHPNLDSLNWVSEEKVFPADKTYEQGLADAWELAKKLFAEYKESELDEIFGKGWSFPKFMEFTPEEALSKIEAYEQKQSLCVGDVVDYKVNEITRGNRGVVTENYNGMISVLWVHGAASTCKASELEKTGKHIDIESLLRQIGE